MTLANLFLKRGLFSLSPCFLTMDLQNKSPDYHPGLLVARYHTFLDGPVWPTDLVLAEFSDVEDVLFLIPLSSEQEL